MNGKLLAQGLLQAKGDELRLVYALIVETGMLDMLVARVKDTFQKDTNHFEEDLQKAIADVAHIPDEQLQLDLFLHILKLLKINGAHYNLLSEIEYGCEQIVDKAFDLQKAQDKGFKQYSDGRLEDKAIQLVMYQMQKVFESFDASMGELSEQQQQAFVENIEQFVGSLPEEKQRELKEKLHIDELTTQTLRQLIVTQGSVLVLTVLVEVAGFTAFTALTSSIAMIAGIFGATLPFGFYVFATSTLSVITGPLAIAAAVVGGGALLKWQNDKVKKMFVPIGIVQLLLPVVLEGEKAVNAEPFIARWTTAFHEQQAHLQQIAALDKEWGEANAGYEQRIRAISEQVQLQTEWQQRIDDEYKVIKKQLPMLDATKFPAAVRSIHSQIQQLQAQITKDEREMAVKKQETGFFNKLKNSVANVATELDIRKIRKTINATEQKLMEALVKTRFTPIHANAIEIERLVSKQQASAAYTKVLQQERDEQQSLRLKIGQALRDERDKLEKLQASVYGLKHIE